eukprot:5511691-Alexandrium_andersonii.AAC.1
MRLLSRACWPCVCPLHCFPHALLHRHTPTLVPVCRGRAVPGSYLTLSLTYSSSCLQPRPFVLPVLRPGADDRPS